MLPNDTPVGPERPGIDQGSINTADQQRQQSNNQDGPSPTIERGTTEPRPEGERIATQGSQCKPKSKLFRRAALQVTFDGLVVFFTAALALTSYLQWKAVRDTLDETRKLAKSANIQAIAAEAAARAGRAANALADASIRQSLESARNDQRAWLIHGQADFDHYWLPGELPSVFVHFQNSWKSPALRVSIKAHLVPYKALPDIMPVLPTTGVPAHSFGVVGPSANALSGVEAEEKYRLTPNMVKTLATKDMFLYAFGTVSYSDTFQRDHKTQWCFRLGPIKVKGTPTTVVFCDRWNTAE